MIRWARAAVIVRAAGHCRRDPQQPPGGVGHHLHVHPVSAVLVGVVGPAVADPVALGKGAVEQDSVRVRLAQSTQQAGSPVGEQVDDGCRVGVGGADGDAEHGSELGEGVVPAQVHQPDQGTLVRWELAAAVTLAGDDEHGDPLDGREAGRVRQNTEPTRPLCLWVETSNTPSTAREPRALRQGSLTPSRSENRPPTRT